MKKMYIIGIAILVIMVSIGIYVFVGEDNITDWIENNQFIDGQWKQDVVITYSDGSSKDISYSEALTVYNDKAEVTAVNWILSAMTIPVDNSPWDDVELDLSGVTVRSLIKTIDTTDYPNEVLVQANHVSMASGGYGSGTIVLKNTGSNQNGVGMITIYGQFNNNIVTIANIGDNSDFGVLTSNFDNAEGTFRIVAYDSGIFNDNEIEVCEINWQGQSGITSLHMNYTRVTEATSQSYSIEHIAIDGTISCGESIPTGGSTIYDETTSVNPSTVIHAINGAWFVVIDQGIDFSTVSNWRSGEQYEVSFTPVGAISFRGISGTQTSDWDSVIASGIVFYINNEGTVGDMNGDGSLNSVDTSYLAKHIIGVLGYEVLYSSGDVNCDGNINSDDTLYLAKHLVNAPGYELLYPTC